MPLPLSPSLPKYLDCEARFFSRSTGFRLAVNPDEILSLAWELVESGGTAQITVEMAHAFDDQTWPVQGGDTVEIWVLGTGETVPRCRGQVGHYDKTLDRVEKYLLTSYGRMEDMNHVVFDRILLEPGGADLQYFAGQIADDYAARRPALKFVRDIQFTNISLERLDQTDTTARSSMDNLQAQSGGNVVWGWDIDPQTGLDRFYLRPKAGSVSNQFFVGGNVKLVSSPSELQNIVNGMKIEGGPAKYPQMMTNPSFEVPSLPDAASGSLLTNGGFELAPPGDQDSVGGNPNILAWTSVGGATHNQHDPATNHNGTAHTGDWYVILDQSGKEVWQECAVTPLTITYCASLYCAREKGSFAAEGTLIVEGRSSAGAVLETYTLPLAPASTAWTGGQPTTTLSSDGISLNVQFANSQTTTARVRIVAGVNGQGNQISGIGGNTQGLLLDDVTFADVTAVGQTGWSTHLQNPGVSANKFNSVDWSCRAAAWDGFYGLRVSVQADGNDRPAIAPAPGDLTSGNGFHYKPAPQQDVRTGFRVRMSPGLSTGAGSVSVEYREWASDGHETQFQSQAFTVPNDGAWHFCHIDVSAHGDVDTATTQATIALSGWYDFDGFTARDVQAGEGADAADPLGTMTFLRGTDFEIYVTAEQVCSNSSTSGSAADTAAAASFGTYGRQEAVVKNDQIVDWNPDAIAWAAAYFGRVAVPLDRPEVVLDHEPLQVPTPADGLQKRISGIRQDVQDWCARAAYVWAKMKLTVTLELDSTRPTWAKLLLNIGSGGGGSSASSIAAVAGGGGNASTPAMAPVTSVAGRTGAVILTTSDISGLGSAATHAAGDFDASGAAAAAQAASLQKSANLSDLGNASTARTNLSLGTAATLNVPAAGSNAAASQVVRGDDTRLGGSFAGSASPALGLLQVAPGYQVAPGNAGFSPAFLLSDKSSGDTTSGYGGISIAAAKPASPTLQSGNAITSGIIAAYPFAENAGTTVHDISGNALHMAFGGTSPTWATGPNGTVLSFGGSGSINCAATSLLQPAGSFTLSALINASATQGTSSPRWWRQGNNGGGYYGLASNGQIALHTTNGGTYNSTFLTASYEGAYHLYTVVLNTDANTLTFYVDGTVIGTSTTATGPTAWDTAGATQYLMGSPNSDYVTGQMDVAYEWGRALSGSEISALAANPYQLIGTTTSGNALTALLDIGPLGFLPITTIKWTRTWSQQLSEVLEYSSNGTAWTAIPTGYTPANNGGTAASLQTTVTLSSPISARFLRYSGKDAGSGGQVLLTDFGVS